VGEGEVIAYLEARSSREPMSGCRIWLNCVQRDGYGTLKYRGEFWMAHRLAYHFAHGPIPDGMNVCHRCDVRCCIEPSHLFLGTQAVNMADCKAKGRTNRSFGERNHRSKLTRALAAAIRMDPRTSRQVALSFGICAEHVRKIRRGAIWGI
jgi:hypothetical protein